MGTAMESTATSANAPDSFLGEMFSVRLYKPSQGRIVRQATCGTIWVTFALAAWRWFETRFGLTWLAEYMTPGGLDAVRYALPGLLLIAGIWIGYRVVNYPRFADFLIAVEAEMNKVTWPSQDELVRSSLVVIILLAAFTAVLYLFDIVWLQLFIWMGVR